MDKYYKNKKDQSKYVPTEHPEVMVSFIMPSYNREPVLKECLTHLYSRNYTFSFEIIVLENNSSDNSVSMIKNNFPKVKLIELKENIGALSRNLGIKKSLGKYIVMLDDDSYPKPGCIEPALEVFKNDVEKKIGCIAFNIQRVDGSFETAGIYTSFTGCGAMFRKDIFYQIGMYPDNYLFYVEEYDLSCRIVNKGLKILNFKELEVVHLKTQVNRNFNGIMTRLVRNNLMLWSKYLPKEFAAPQIKLELWRYHYIALKEDALPGYDEGCRQGKKLIEKYRHDRSNEISNESTRQMLALDEIHRRVSRLQEYGTIKTVLIFNFGKLIYFLLQEIAKEGFEVMGIIDDNVHMQQTTYSGVPIYPRKRMEAKDFDAIVIGSSSLALNDLFEKQLKQLDLNIPIIRLCDYDKLPNYIPTISSYN